MTENTPLIIPELVALDADAGPGKEDVIEFLAATVAGAGRASSPDGLAADAKKRESTAPTGIPGGIAIPHCRSSHVLAPSLGFARLAQPVDFGAADGRDADLIFMIAAPDGADDFHLQLLAKLARGLMQTDFTDALRQAADAEEIARIVTGQVQPELLEEGLSELTALLEAAGRRRPGAVIADLKIARGLDYYTGTVYESFMSGHEDLGSVCSGGRYDSLATNGKRTFPGVGISIGLSRLLARVIGEGLVEVSRPVPTVVLVAVTDEAHRSASDAIADTLRARGISADVAPSAAKFGKQIKAADKRSIPFVWFPGADGGPDSVKDIRSGEQVEADAATWQPPGDDAAPRITARLSGADSAS